MSTDSFLQKACFKRQSAALMSPTVSMQKAFFKRQSAALMSTDGFYAEGMLQAPVGCTDVYRRFLCRRHASIASRLH
jgi:hypothetical protein